MAEDLRYFKEGICRRCIHINFKEPDYHLGDLDSDYILNFELTPLQKKVADDLLKHIRVTNVFLEAVCGAGKTEICYEMIKTSLMSGEKVGWAIPRRQVVLELGERIKSNFKNLKIVYVCEGYTDQTVGDLIICTTHQLFRYHQYFDYLIVDEPDAFPFFNNDLLKGIMWKSVKKHVLFMSATYDENLLNDLGEYVHIKLPLRPNYMLLPIPNVHRSLFGLIKKLWMNRNEKNLIFVPTIKLAEVIGTLFHLPVITSKTKNKEEIIEKFRLGEIKFLVSTTVLERGVTFENCFVYVLMAFHTVFTKASLIQISGRVMRGNSTIGACYFHVPFRSREVDKCIKSLEDTNRIALSVLKK